MSVLETLPTLKIAKKTEIEEKAAAIKEKRALPEPPGKLVAFKDLTDWLSLLSEDNYDRVTIWVYRREPIINRQLVDPSADNNIDIIFNTFEQLTIDYMIKHHGGGNYKFTVKDGDKPKTQLGGFFEATLNIPMAEYPPILDLREVEWDNPRNKGFKAWCRSRRMIDDNNMPVIEKKEIAQPVTQGLDANMLKMMLDFTAKMSEKEQIALKKQIGGEEAVTKSMNELFLEKLKQDDPNKQMTMVLSLVTAMKSMQPEVKPDNTMTTILPIIMKMMDDSRAAADRQQAMMLELFKQRESDNKPVAEVDEMDKLEKLLNLAAKIKGGNVGRAEEKSTVDTLLEKGMEVLPSVLGIVGNIIALNAQAKGVGVTPAPTIEVTPNATEQMNKVNMEQTKQQVQPQLPTNEAANMIAQYGPIIMNKLSGEGWEFGAWVAEGFGDMAAAAIIKHGPEGLLNAAKSVPTFWQQVETTYGEPHLIKWLQSLCNYKEIMKQMEMEEIEEEKVN